MLSRLGASLAAAAALAASVGLFAQEPPAARPLTAEDRLAILRRSQVWTPTDVSKMDLKKGPAGSGAFAPGETVTCDFVERKFKGKSPKFQCKLPDGDEVKVKYGQTNGEVFGEVAGTRLLWALGFGADRMYPVRVICHGCPAKLQGAAGGSSGESVFEVAAIERKYPGKLIETHDGEGWSWKELDLVDEAAGGAPTAHRDALKLLAVFMQHSDNKDIQQKIVCLDKQDKKAEKKSEKTAAGDMDADNAGEKALDDALEEDEARNGISALCAHPFMLIDDLGLTFARSDILDRQDMASVNFDRWSKTPIWKTDNGCIGNLPKSLSGSMHDPVISEAGRKFLSDLLAQLSDAQIHDLFEVAKVDQRKFAKPAPDKVSAPIDEWVAAFKQKRDTVASRHCN